MGVKLSTDTLNTARETSDCGSGHGTPPLIGNCTASKDNHISIGHVVSDLFYVCVEEHDFTFNRRGDLLVAFELKKSLEHCTLYRESKLFGWVDHNISIKGDLRIRIQVRYDGHKVGAGKQNR